MLKRRKIEKRIKVQKSESLPLQGKVPAATRQVREVLAATGKVPATTRETESLVPRQGKLHTAARKAYIAYLKPRVAARKYGCRGTRLNSN